MYLIKRYDNCEVRNLDVRYIIENSKKGNFDIPNSQREKEWLPEQNSKFVLSILENKPIGTIVLNKRGNKKYILDGQHRINAIELFCGDNIGVQINNINVYYSGKSMSYLNKSKTSKTNKLSDDDQKLFLETKMIIIEYDNLTDNEMKEIIESINEGIKNDCVSKPNLNNIIDIEQIINKYNELISNTVFNKNYNKLKLSQRDIIKKIIGMIGTIIDNFDSYDSNDDYKQLSCKHVERFMSKIQKDDNIENILNNIYEFIKIIYSDKLLNNDKILELNEDNDFNNYFLNTILYKLYEQYVKEDGDNKNLRKNIQKNRNIIVKLIENYSKNKFKDLLDLYDELYQKKID
jgi:hypothetical protein